MATLALQFTRSTVGKKVLMAVTGIALYGFVIGHMIGNLQVYIGPESLNSYAATLHSYPVLLWIARIGLLVCLAVHMWAAISLSMISKAARKDRYQTARKWETSNFASRTMRYSGPIIFLYVLYHLAHLTWGNAHHDFVQGDVYHNVIAGFSSVPVSIIYMLANIVLGVHLLHGVWSAFQTMGANNQVWTGRLRILSMGLVGAIVLGNVSMPLAVLTGCIS